MSKKVNQTNQIKLGDVVSLKSGSMDMTVIALNGDLATLAHFIDDQDEGPDVFELQLPVQALAVVDTY